jgi:hypothetical protein
MEKTMKKNFLSILALVVTLGVPLTASEKAVPSERESKEEAKPTESPKKEEAKPEEDDKCAVCLDVLKNPESPDSVIILEQCKHKFHLQCITRDSRERDKCPNCRTKYSPKEQHLLPLVSYASETLIEGHDSLKAIVARLFEEKWKKYRYPLIISALAGGSLYAFKGEKGLYVHGEGLNRYFKAISSVSFGLAPLFDTGQRSIPTIAPTASQALLHKVNNILNAPELKFIVQRLKVDITLALIDELIRTRSMDIKASTFFKIVGVKIAGSEGLRRLADAYFERKLKEKITEYIAEHYLIFPYY